MLVDILNFSVEFFFNYVFHLPINTKKNQLNLIATGQSHYNKIIIDIIKKTYFDLIYQII